MIEQFREKLIGGMRQRGLSETFAEQVFQPDPRLRRIRLPRIARGQFRAAGLRLGVAEVLLPGGVHRGAVEQPADGILRAAQLVSDARRHGVDVRGVDVNDSRWDCTLEPAEGERGPPWALRLGLRMVSGLAQELAARIVESRAAGPFPSLNEFAQRTSIGRAAMTRLSQADAFASLGQPRRAALAVARSRRDAAAPRPLWDGRSEPDDAAEAIPETRPIEEVVADYRAIGLSLSPIRSPSSDRSWRRTASPRPIS